MPPWEDESFAPELFRSAPGLTQNQAAALPVRAIRAAPRPARVFFFVGRTVPHRAVSGSDAGCQSGSGLAVAGKVDSGLTPRLLRPGLSRLRACARHAASP